MKRINSPRQGQVQGTAALHNRNARIFDAQENSTTSGGTPYCDFVDQNQRYLRGGNLLCAYGPLFFPMLEAELPKLSPIHWEYVQRLKTEDDVDVLLAKTFARQDMLSKRRLHFFSRYSYSTLCRTVTKQDRAARESTTPVISLRLLYLLHKLSTAQIALLDYLLHKSPCWSPAFYEKRVPKIRTVFLQHCEDNHRKAREEFEGVK